MTENKDSGVYAIRVNNRVYFGRTVNFNRRKNGHLRSLKQNLHHNIILQNSFNKNSDFEFKPIFFSDKKELQVIVEQVLITTRDCCNIGSAKDGANPGVAHFLYGKQLSEGVRHKIRNSLVGHKPSESTRQKISSKMKGRKPSESTRQKISQTLIGHKLSESTKQKISSKLTGIKRTESIIQKMRLHKVGAKNWNFDSTKYVWVNNDGMRIEATGYYMITNFGLDRGSVCLMKQGKRKVHKGWRIEHELV